MVCYDFMIIAMISFVIANHSSHSGIHLISILQTKHTAKLNLFPATFPLESVALDYLGPLPTTKNGYTHLLVITYRYSKLTRSIPLKRPNARSTARAFCENWAFVYDPPVTMLAENGGHFTARFFQDVCLTMGVRNLYTTTYPPRTNGQTERFNRTIVSSLGHYVNSDQNDWNDYVTLPTYSYDTQTHRNTDLSPFDLVLTRTTPSLTMPPLSTLTGISAKEMKEEFLSLLRETFKMVEHRENAAQQSYKEYLDRGSRPRKPPAIGSYVYVRRNVTDKRTPESQQQVKSNQLRYRVNGPFEVINISTESNTVTILEEGLEDTVSADHVVPSTRIAELRPNLPPHIASNDDNRQLTRYVFDTIVNHGYNPEESTTMMYIIRLHGFNSSHDTWQYAQDLPYNTVVRYCRRWNIPQPPNLGT